MQVQQRAQLLPLRFLELKKKLHPTGTCWDLRTHNVVLILTAGLAVAISFFRSFWRLTATAAIVSQISGSCLRVGRMSWKWSKSRERFRKPWNVTWLRYILFPQIHSITVSVARGIQRADFSQQFSHLASKCIIAHAISPLALRIGSNVSGWLSPPHCSTQGVQDHIALLCYHPSAFPAPCNLCRVLPTLPSQSQVLLAHTLLHIVTQMLSINTPSVKKKKLCTTPLFPRLSMASYNSISLFFSQTSL